MAGHDEFADELVRARKRGEELGIIKPVGELSIEPGEIRVVSVDVVLDQPHAKVWHADLDSKHAQVLAVSNEAVLLYADEGTRGLDESLRGTPTGLRYDLSDEWNIVVECNRYTCRIVAYRTQESDATCGR